MLNIEELINNATKSKQMDDLFMLRLIKTEILKKEKEPGRTSSVISEDELNQILIKMVSQRKDSITEFKKANRNDLVEKEEKELAFLLKYAPKEIPDEEIAAFALTATFNYLKSKDEGYVLSMKDMGPILKVVKEKYPSEKKCGAIVSNVLRHHATNQK